MAELKDGEATPKETQGSPNPASSEESVATPTFSEEQVRQILSSPVFREEITTVAREAATSSAQSMGDKKIYQMEQKVNEVLDQYRELLGEGWSEQQAQRLMNIEAKQAPVEEQPEPSSQGRENGSTDLNFKSVFEAAGIDPASGTAVELAKRSGNDPAKLVRNILEVVKSDGNGGASPAGVVGEAGGGVKDNDIAEITDPDELLTMWASRRQT